MQGSRAFLLLPLQGTEAMIRSRIGCFVLCEPVEIQAFDFATSRFYLFFRGSANVRLSHGDNPGAVHKHRIRHIKKHDH